MTTRTHPGFRVFADGLLPLLSDVLLRTIQDELNGCRFEELDEILDGMPVRPKGWLDFCKLWDGYTREYMAWRLAELCDEELKRRAGVVLST